ncbi:MAG: ABC transporter ATP-binding protein [Thaumarchaeota archaeon]|nr:ABC transporter ATP-binding protein [Nitrososphaerota archaeon]
MSLIKVSGLTIAYEFRQSKLIAVNAVDLDIGEREFLAVVGESGCGKSTLALSMIGLLPKAVATIVGGSIIYKGTDLVKLNAKELRKYRGTEIAMIFQEPLTSLNPVYRVGEQLAEAIVIRENRAELGEMATSASDVMQETHRVDEVNVKVSRLPRGKKRISSDLKAEAVEALKLVRIADPEQVLERYPFELSGGMRQRVMIAMALSQRPKLLVADEPTTALDVTTQAQVLKLMKELMTKVNTSIMLITHDLAVASQVADRVVVMYAAEVVEDSDVFSLFSEPMHPYTKGLLSCIPTGSKDDTKLMPIPGSVPDLVNPPVGCRYAARCPYVMDVCRTREPPLVEVKPRHKVACFLYGQ